MNKVNKLVGVAILVVITFSLGIFAGRQVESGFVDALDPTKIVRFTGDTNGGDIDIENVDFGLFWNVWKQMTSDYVDKEKVDEKEMFYGAIQGMVNSYGDPATLYLTPEETAAFNDSTAGNLFSGIGAEMGYKDGLIVIISPLKGSPASSAGIQPGDVVLAVDGVDVTTNDSLFDIVLKIRGEEGTDVTLTVLHTDESTPVDITITRGQITVSSMEFKLSEKDPSIAIFDVSRFTEADLRSWQNKWDQMVSQFQESNAEALIIDLRGNPGGFFNAAVYAANEFLKEGTIVSKQQDQRGAVTDFTVTRKGKLLDVPVVVLVNNGSASASEIMSGALQKNNRATVVGIPTYGKGTAQDVRSFPDGSSLHITTLKWLLPDGTWINPDDPIIPDVNIDLTDEDFKQGIDPQMDSAIDILQTEIR